MVANRIAKWSGTAWSALDSGTGTGNGLNDAVYAVAVAPSGEVYVGGSFSRAGGVVANHIAKWNGTGWSALGAGTNNIVFALAVAANGDLYVGGSFTLAGSALASYIAKWNGSAWSRLGTGTGLNNYVYALAVASTGEVYAGGQFTQAGGAAANRVAKWSGTAWSSLGTGTANGVDNSVYALAVAGTGEVYVGGYLNQAGGVAANYVARWNGTGWSSLGTGTANGTAGYVDVLAVAPTGEVYAGGTFARAGGTAASRIAKWNGTAWSSLGAGSLLDIGVYALAVAGNGDVYASGTFTQGGSTPATGVAKWNGTTWSSLGTGVNNSLVNDLAIGPTGKLYAGGRFTATGDGSKLMSRFGIYDPNAPLATAAAMPVPAVLFPNPAHGTATLRLPATAERQPLALHDALGRVARRYPAPAGPEAVLDLRGLPAGTYVLRCGQFSQHLMVE